MVCEVVQLRTHTLKNIPEVLRQIADQIENGEFPGADQCAVVVSGADAIDVCLCGEVSSPADAHFLLAAGMQRLVDAVYPQ